MPILDVFLQVPAVSSAIVAHWTVMVVDVSIMAVIGGTPLTRSGNRLDFLNAALSYVVQETSFVRVTASTLVANVWFDGMTVVAARAVSSCRKKR